ncbi:MAG: hypothetical protein KGM43_04635, partial [Planctomycetota bacterium]|nr:hypothetical protein [Planctomycetota bacterium]
MNVRFTRCLRLLALALIPAAAVRVCGAADDPVVVSSRPLHEGRISPMLFGNFIELLDDLVPGMRAEMLNDRGFEGVVPAARWVYYDGAPTFCDRVWEPSADWSIEHAGGFTGPNCARISPRGGAPARLAQAGLAVQKGATYRFSAYLRGEPGARVRALLKTRRPDGDFDELAVLELGVPSSRWARVEGLLAASGTSDLAVFELRVAGDGTVWADQISLQPAENADGWRLDVVEAIKASRPALIRWGGSVVDPGAYRWKAGVGDRDLRVPFANVNWGRIDSNDVGIAEFCRFCELTAARPLVCVSFSDGPTSAADLVEYCNGSKETTWGARRAADGHAAPFHVKYWQLGNELSGDDDTYVKKCRDFIASMKAVDPSIAILSSFPSQKVVEVLGKDLSHLAPHHYTRDLAACEADFRKLATMIASTPERGRLRLAVTEWNFTGGDWGLGRGKMLTLEGALWNAQYLNLMCRYANIVEIGCR